MNGRRRCRAALKLRIVLAVPSLVATAEVTIDSARTAPSAQSFAASLRGFGVPGLIAIALILAGNIVVVPLSAILVLVWTQWSRTPWAEIGYVRPRSWAVEVASGILFGCAFKLLMKAAVMPLLGADPVNQAYHYLAGNRA